MQHYLKIDEKTKHIDESGLANYYADFDHSRFFPCFNKGVFRLVGEVVGLADLKSSLI